MNNLAKFALILANVIPLCCYQFKNYCLSKQNEILYIEENYMLPISGHPQVQNWSLKHNEEEIYIM